MLLDGTGLADADVLVAGGRVAGFCSREARVDAREVVDVTGLVVLPGAIDAHVHLGQDITVPKEPEDVAAETRSAAAGGVTTFLVYLMSAAPYESLFAEVKALMEAHAAVDFGFHFCISTEEQLAAVERYVRELGVSSFKFFMNFRGDEGKYLNLPANDDGFLFELLRRLARCGGMLCPHPENIELIWRLRREAPAAEGRGPLELWYDSRPPVAEAEAVQRAAYLARAAGAPIYAVHVSSAEALDAALLQRRRWPVFIETCPHYLTHDVYAEVGELGKVNPPLRQPADREALWRAVAEGLVDTVGSDHVPRHKSKKAGGIWKASAGFPGMETLLPVMISEGCHKRGIALERIVRLMTKNPARLFGLYPRKGAVAVGADADFAIVDLHKEQRIEAGGLHSAAGYSIYEGWTVRCTVVHTVVRGRFVKRDGQLVDAAGYGRYQFRAQSGQGEGGDVHEALGRRY